MLDNLGRENDIFRFDQDFACEETPSVRYC